MGRALLTAALLAALSAPPALAQEEAEPRVLTGAAEGLGAADAAAQRDAAWANCILYGHEQAALVKRFTEAGWTRQDYPEEEEVTFSLHAPAAPEALWVMLYEGDRSCSVVDLATGTTEAGATIARMLDPAVFDLSRNEDEACPAVLASLPAKGGAAAMVFSVQVISGADYADCSSEEASAVLVYTLD